MIRALTLLAALTSGAAYGQTLNCWPMDDVGVPFTVTLNQQTGTATFHTGGVQRLGVTDDHYRITTGQGGGFLINRNNGLGAFVAPVGNRPLYFRCEAARRL